jgi:hypothetical protein
VAIDGDTRTASGRADWNRGYMPYRSLVTINRSLSQLHLGEDPVTRHSAGAANSMAENGRRGPACAPGPVDDVSGEERRPGAMPRHVLACDRDASRVGPARPRRRAHQKSVSLGRLRAALLSGERSGTR